jgi:hypothetical protein
MNMIIRCAAFTLSFVTVCAVAGADTIELKNGTAVQGKYVSGTATTISIETAQGVLAVPIADMVALKFGEAPATAPAAGAAAPAAAAVPAAAAAPAAPVTIPAGTVLTVRMESPVSSKDKEGTKFTAKLLADLMAGNTVAAKAGTTVYGEVDKSKQAGRLAGKSQLAISLTGIDMSGKVLPIMTSNFAEAGKSEGRKTARNAAVGGLVGAAADDDGGAGKGAAIGAGVSLIKKGDSVTVPVGALLEFKLTQPVTTTP